MTKPVLSIITVVLDSKINLEDTIQSVICQTYENIEYIIIDGGSTDGTLDIVKKYQDKISYFVSEPDTGIYEAMNKGIKAAKGQIVNFLNSGDTYYSSEVLAKVACAFEDDALSLVYGLTEQFFKDPAVSYVSGRKINQKILWQWMPISHQSLFLKIAVLKKIGFYDTQYAIAADYEFLCRFLTMTRDSLVETKFLNHVLVRYNNDGASSRNYLRTLNESVNVSKKYFGMSFTHRAYFSLRYIKYCVLSLGIKLGIMKYYRKIKYSLKWQK